jgi:hypothetical protein
MSLDLPTVLPQVEQMGRTLAERQAEAARRLPIAQAALNGAARLSAEDLQARIARAGDRWRGALPSLEPLDQTYSPPAHPARLTLIAADGSQIYPDRHAVAFYYVINVGSIVIHHGSGEPPLVNTRPDVHFEDTDLHDPEGGSVTTALINGLRDAAELDELASLAEQDPERPCLALLDNGLLLWLALQVRDQDRRQIDRVLQAYLGHLDRLRAADAVVAGYIDRPRSSDVLALLHLAMLEKDQITDERLRASPFRGLTDRSLFGRFLPEGHRSAAFIEGSPLNRDFEKRHHGVGFFYLHTAAAEQIARVEVPEWVAQDPAMMGLVHAALLEQARSTGGFPYPLVRAHELAVITQNERREFDRLLSGVMQRHGMQARVSQKALTKRWTGDRKRHRV